MKLEQSPVSKFTLIKKFNDITGTGSSINLGVITPDGLDYLPVGLYMIQTGGGSGDVFYLPFAQVKITTNVEFIYFDDRFETEISFSSIALISCPILLFVVIILPSYNKF